MTAEIMTKVRREIARAVRHEVDALTSLYRIDNLLGEIDGLYEMEFNSFLDTKAEGVKEPATVAQDHRDVEDDFEPDLQVTW